MTYPRKRRILPKEKANIHTLIAQGKLRQVDNAQFRIRNGEGKEISTNALTFLIEKYAEHKRDLGRVANDASAVFNTKKSSVKDKEKNRIEIERILCEAFGKKPSYAVQPTISPEVWERLPYLLSGKPTEVLKYEMNISDIHIRNYKGLLTALSTNMDKPIEEKTGTFGKVEGRIKEIKDTARAKGIDVPSLEKIAEGIEKTYEKRLQKLGEIMGVKITKNNVRKVLLKSLAAHFIKHVGGEFREDTLPEEIKGILDMG